MTMSLLSIARPYATAAFQNARATNSLTAWKDFLAAAALVAKDPDMVKLLANPEIASGKVFDLFESLLKPYTEKPQRNFLLLLTQNKRLSMLPEISDLFASYFAQLEKMSTVRVVTAVDIEQNFRQKLIDALSKRIQQEVKLECEVDPNILGGAIIHIGDRVIDGSIRGKLARLLEFSLR